MKVVKKHWLDILTLAAVITFAIMFTEQIVLSWFGGSGGLVEISYNSAHERIAETIIIPLLAVLVIVKSSKELSKKLKGEKNEN